jgi:hypothetical protein
MDVTEQLKDTAIMCLGSVVALCTGQGGWFATMSGTVVGDGVVPTLLVGFAELSRVGDGHCAAILNPDKRFMKRIGMYNTLTGAQFKKLVARHCDAAIQVTVDSRLTDSTNVAVKYVARKPKHILLS